MSLIEQWIRPEVRAIDAYHVPDASGLIKLDAMENPHAWPEELREEWARLIRDTDVNRYPDPHARQLTLQLRTAMQISAEAGVLLGNGSDEIIQMLALALGGQDRTLLSVEPGFVMYRLIAAFSGLDYIGIELNGGDFSLDMEALLKAIDAHQPALLFLAYPNNPTGNLFAVSDVERIITASPGLVIIDEAYAPFTDASFMPRIGEFDNMVVMRTLSKMGLAGLRLGLLAGPAEWIKEIDKTRLPYNINVLTQLSASFALSHISVFDSQTAAICEARSQLFEELQEIADITPFQSEANFILVRTAEGEAPSLFEGLKQCGVLIKNLHGSHPLLKDCLRITVGTEAENRALIEALKFPKT
ncbi:MAG TPA: histidinol-phosphate transaminase [Gammaproteobacteria bacterium]|nr:histidinol-phosphate transaminase [Gammaproteobacteria bacterium]